MPFRMTIIKKGRNNKQWRGCEKTRPTHTVGENVNWCSHYGKQHRVLKTLRIDLPYDPGVPLLAFYTEDIKTLI